MQLETEISPIDGLDKEQFEKIRGQIIEYIKMYSTDGETIGAWKILRYLQPYFKKGDTLELGSKGTVGIVYNFNQPHKPVDCELLAIYKDGRIVVQCYDIHGEKWESETFSRIEFFNPKVESKAREVCPKCNWPIAEYNDNGVLECYWCGEVEKANDCLPADSSTTVSVGKKLKEYEEE